MKLEIPSGLEKIVENIKNKGGKSLLVGGAVIDSIQDRELKDWDIEVYKLSYDSLKDLLAEYGEPNLVGKEFGVIKLRVDDVEYDFSIPRLENSVGVGHKDFEIKLVPNIDPKEAAYRRDLTINSMFFDLIEKKLMDPYNGYDDLKKGILRHTSEKFTEDSLRVLRIMQLLPRKGKVVANETIELCKSLIDEYSNIPKERVFEEWNKLLMKSSNPSLGLEFLEDCGWIKHYPELDKLRETPQNPLWHPEGTAWIHTKMVVDNAAKLKRDIPEEWQKAYMYGCLLHDVGKAVTTTEELISHGHAQAGVEIAKEFMSKMTNDKRLIDNVLDIVGYHMRPGQLVNSGGGENAWKRLHNKIPLNIIGYVSKADATGRTGRSLNDEHLPLDKALELFKEYGKEKIPAVLMGRDLIAKGYEPGPEIGKMVKKAYKIQIDENINDKELLFEKVKI